MDEAFKHETARRWLTAFTEAMEAEAVPDRTRRRVLNRVMFGNPDGDEQARFRLEPWQQQAELMRRAMEDTGRGLTQILNAAGFEQLEVRWADHAEETMVDENPRFVLRAFTDSNAVRLASILCDLADERSTRTLSREHVAAVWTVRCPRHLRGSGKRNVNGRIREGLCYLKAARLVAVDGDAITLLDLPQLKMSASNLPIVTDEHGVSRPPSQWPAQPAVPDRLRAVQQALTDKLTEETDRGE